MKNVFLVICKYAGLFSICRYLTKYAVRVLCYHGISLDDEHLFRSNLFMRESLFRERLTFLARANYPVISLEEALEGLKSGDLPHAATVITIDDGWYGMYAKGLPILAEFGFPATLYLTTYYIQKQLEVFDVLIGYLFWRTNKEEIDLSEIHINLNGKYCLSDPAQASESVSRVVHCGSELDSGARQNLARSIAKALDVDFQEIEATRQLRLMTLEETQKAVSLGFDIQLHTHRHYLDVNDPQQVADEIRANRRVLEPITGRPLKHFCYPCGIYHLRVWPWLERQQIQSATTCSTGLCHANTPRMALSRIVDGESISPVEFEAELSGLLEIWRGIRTRMRFVTPIWQTLLLMEPL